MQPWGLSDDPEPPPGNNWLRDLVWSVGRGRGHSWGEREQPGLAEGLSTGGPRLCVRAMLTHAPQPSGNQSTEVRVPEYSFIIKTKYDRLAPALTSYGQTFAPCRQITQEARL